LQCVAACCSVLQCVAVCCSVLQCVAVCCSVLQRVAACHGVLQNVTVLLCVNSCSMSHTGVLLMSLTMPISRSEIRFAI